MRNAEEESARDKELFSDVGGIAPLQKRDELDQPFARLPQLES
jgi:hypothetical protein